MIIDHLCHNYHLIIHVNLLVEMEDEVGISVSSRHRVHPKLLHKEHLVRVLLG